MYGARDGKRGVSEQNVRKRKQILGGKGGKRGVSHSQQNGRKGKRALKTKGGKMDMSEKNTVMEAENENIPPKEGRLEEIPTQDEGLGIMAREGSGYNGSDVSSEGDTREGQGSFVKDSLFLDLDRSE